MLEAHNGLSSRIVEQSNFDGIWVSSLTESASKGLPDNEITSGEERLRTIREIRRASSKPIIVDWDTGGQVEHFTFWLKELERAGVSAVVIEDKSFPKRNSLLKGDKLHILEDVDKFSEKIKRGKEAVEDMMVIARLESLIAKKSMYEALIRAEAFLKAGADGIVIHSKSEVSAREVMEFAEKYKKEFSQPLVAIPTTYDLPTEHPFDIVIYANHLLRASLKAMKDFVETFDKNKLAKVEDIFKIIGYEDRSTKQ